MAGFLELRRNSEKILVELEHLAKEAEYARQHENKTAIVIQSVWRGYQVRSHVQFLNQCASIIQRWWRRHKAKQIYRDKLEEHVLQLRLNYYDSKAVKIQKIWRGYYVRKYVLDYYSRKRYLNGLEITNEQIRIQLIEYRDYLEQKQLEQQRQTNIAKLEEEAKRTHYLVSTKVVPGIYNSKYLEAPKEMEIILRSTKFDRPKRTKSLKVNKDEEISAVNKFLPPLKPKPQGPFRAPEDVRYQRYRPLKPSLRCETDYFATEKIREEIKLQEWVERVHDDTFRAGLFRDKPYPRLLVGEEPFVEATKLERLSLREPNKQQWINEKGFRSLVHGIPEFDKLETTYVEPHFYYSTS
ncbi:unnamed protein product [Adineta steineri]|uniref:Spermatogenesis-associated protein 17 n=1 Tax=Adineta steineri TaxID=433720 RepID=A0A813MEY0_9BILA|nr:unnamed protein product [Adineta steineri]CAF0731923.1 unnamed protein product [Adineta steineri]CAF3691380.1 unnamed protein product [Adineta steineri]CAF3771364.1 unnamed protein product [Adineta steineri]